MALQQAVTSFPRLAAKKLCWQKIRKDGVMAFIPTKHFGVLTGVHIQVVLILKITAARRFSCRGQMLRTPQHDLLPHVPQPSKPKQLAHRVNPQPKHPIVVCIHRLTGA